MHAVSFIFKEIEKIRNMKKKAGLYMDYRKAYLIVEDNNNKFYVSEIIESAYQEEKEEGETSDTTFWGKGGVRASNNENRKNQKQQNRLKEYYYQLQQKLQEYDEILLLGPTKAKDELKNFLLKNKHFQDKHIMVKSADKLTDNQKIAEVRAYFC